MHNRKRQNCSGIFAEQRSPVTRVGDFDVVAVMFCYIITLVLIGWVGYQMHLGWAFYSGLCVAAGIAAYHYTLIRNREPAQCFKAFLHNNWLGAAIFIGIVTDYAVM